MTGKQIIENQLKLLKDQLDVPGICVGCIEHQIEDLEIVLKDLNELEKLRFKEKSLAVEYTSDGYADGYPVYDIAECTSCGTLYDVDGEHYKYCPHCGQRLDWKI